MRLICLNTWGGRLYEPFLDFLTRYQGTTDIFCFQEIFRSTGGEARTNFQLVPDLYERLAKQLEHFQSYVTEPSTSFGERLAIFASKSTMIDQNGDTVLCEQRTIEANGEKMRVGSRLQWVALKHHGEMLTIANVHGIWLPGGKNDTPERIEQSQRISRFLQRREGAKILCGDLNLLPDAHSIGILEQNMRNLVRDYRILSTRSSQYPPDKAKFADYVFTSPELRVLDFRVLLDEVSDHLPLLLEFS